MQASLAHALTLVSAPAGFGKTTLVSEWVHQVRRDKSVAWFSIDSADNDPVRFWDYFIAALKTTDAGVGDKALSVLHAAQPIPMESIITSLANDLAGVTEDFVLVLDDYHFVKTPSIHAGLTFLLEHLPPRMHLIIATRTDPSLPVSRLRGRGIMLEIRASDLRFTLEEATDLLKTLQTPALSVKNIESLNVRAEGWAVGLKMAAISIRGKKDLGEFISAFVGSENLVMDYLLDEVLQQQTAFVREFLLKTSVLERMNSLLCDAVTGWNNSRDILKQLEHDNLFIVPLDEARDWYRYEHLFASLLRHQMELALGKGAAAKTHQLASRWFEENSLSEEAIEHSLAAQDWQKAVDLIFNVLEKYKRTGEMATLLKWLRAIPEAALQTNIEVYLHYVLALLLTGDLDAAEAVLDKAAQIYPGEEGLILFYRANVARSRWDLPLFVELSKKALPLLAPRFLPARAALTVGLGDVQYRRCCMNEAEALFKEALEISQKAQNRWMAGTSLGYLGHILHYRGKLHQAAEVCKQGIEAGEASAGAVLPHLFLSVVLYEWNDLDSAALHLEKAVEINRLWGSEETQAGIYSSMAALRFARGDVSGAREAMDKFDELVQSGGTPRMLVDHLISHLWLALAEHDCADAWRWSERLAGQGDSIPWHGHLLLIQAKVARGEKAAAQRQIRAYYDHMQGEGDFLDQRSPYVALRVLEALSAGILEKALILLSEALHVARPGGYIRTFVNQGAVLTPLLRKAISQGVEPEYSASLLKIIESEDRRYHPAHPVQSVLSERELDVLRLLDAGLPDKQVAERLFISLSTAKTHVRHIFDKLDARSRTDALARARELKLI